MIFGPNAAGKSDLFDAINLVARMVKSRNLKQAFEEHRGLPIESVHYARRTITELMSEKETHEISLTLTVLASSTPQEPRIHWTGKQ